MANRGRPTSYNKEVATEICARIAEGESLRSICEDEHLPNRRTVNQWLIEGTYEDFNLQYARAREAQADFMADDIVDIADDARNDWMERKGKDDVGYELNGENIQRSRLRVDARKWKAGKLAPKKYGDKTTTELTGKDGGAVQVECRSPDEIVRNFAFTVARMAQEKG